MFSTISLGARARPQLGRVTTRRFYSTKTGSSHWGRNAVLGGLITGPGLWWATSGRDVSNVVDVPDVPDVPRLDTPPTDQLTFGPGLSPDQVTRIISQNAYSVPVTRIASVARYDGTQWASNSPCEDRFLHGQFPSPWRDGKQWMAWAVFDGHAGWQTAELLKHQMLPYVRHSLEQIRSDASVPPERIQEALIKGFLNLDASIFKTAEDASRSDEPLQDKIHKMEPAYAGSCALLSILDTATSTLHVACTGDSRAVLGQQRPDGTWEAIPLSVDQSGTNEEEIARLQKEHPGEENIIKDGRVLGIMVSRAFGDSRWKWALDFQKEMHKRFYGPAPLTPRYDVRTPPYLTAEPVVTSTKIDPSRPSFMIMASDGLWDHLSSEQAVGLMGKWLESSEKNPSAPTSPAPSDFIFDKGVEERFVEERTTVQDGNAAVHLTRNAFGGNQHELIAGRLGFGSPFSRNARDDITVQVVFFHDPKR
ncbi:protein serine/threonine phosphatase 2C [Penicillium odoratum]|uniref:protein serine/threonine phosphatase 2C n=1 Tax=Penicillium odoratum TaxID=1167516 RepID=UPI00254923DC|nr:protein serine/threonine phosphatase 2C [Penicillium odoratum]KAJ5761212.1 protein serine/threonine phosphatase 2C [Penicillium odoratum]